MDKTINILLELRDKKIKADSINKKKIHAIKVMNLILTIVLIVAIIILGILIKPHVEKYIVWIKSPIVCIDAGHGGSATGATKDDIRLEKDDNLALSLAVRDILEKNGVRVIMTRDSDKDLSLAKRCEIANDKNAALFISLHRNEASQEAKGVEVWTGKVKDEKESLLANNILKSLLEYPYTTNRGVKFGTATGESSDYYVNRFTSMPSVIVETGFITNEEDNKLYDEYFIEYARAISKGIVDTIVTLFPEEVDTSNK